MNDNRVSIDECSMEDWDEAALAARNIVDAKGKTIKDMALEAAENIRAEGWNFSEGTGSKLIDGVLQEEENDEEIIQVDWLGNEIEKPLDKQVGGSHYKDKGIQPLEMTYKNFGYQGLKAAVYTKVNKYLLRDKDNEIEDINKAIHCLEILLQHLEE